MGRDSRIKKYLHLQSFLLKYSYRDLLGTFRKCFHFNKFYDTKYNLIEKEVRLSRCSMESGLRPLVFTGNDCQVLTESSFRLNITTID